MNPTETTTLKPLDTDQHGKHDVKKTVALLVLLSLGILVVVALFDGSGNSTALSSDSSSATSPSDTFVAAMHTAFPSINNDISDSSMVTVAEGFCNELDNGTTPRDIAIGASDAVQAGDTGTSTVTEEEIGGILGGAAMDICPVHNDAVQAFFAAVRAG